MNLARSLTACSVAVVIGALTPAMADESDASPATIESRASEHPLATAVKEDSVEEAVQQLDQWVTAHPDDKFAPLLRLTIAERLAGDKQYREALTQIERLLRYQKAHLKDSAVLSSLQPTTRCLLMVGFRPDAQAYAVPIAKDAMVALQAEFVDSSNVAIAVPLASLARFVIGAQYLPRRRDDADLELVRACEWFHEKAVAADSSAEVIEAWAMLMQNRIWIASGVGDFSKVLQLYKEVEPILDRGTHAYPKSVSLLTIRLGCRSAAFSAMWKTNPEAARVLLDETEAIVEKSTVKDNAAIQRLSKGIDRFRFDFPRPEK